MLNSETEAKASLFGLVYKWTLVVTGRMEVWSHHPSIQRAVHLSSYIPFPPCALASKQ